MNESQCLDPKNSHTKLCAHVFAAKSSTRGGNMLAFAAEKDNNLRPTSSGCAQGTPRDTGRNFGVEQGVHPSAKGQKGRFTKTSLPLMICLVNWLESPILSRTYLRGLPLTALWL